MARNKYAPTILLLSALCLSCNLNSGGANSASAPSSSQKNADGNFDAFFTRFKTDSVFQKSRIRFPLKIKFTAGESCCDATNLIPAGGLPYIDTYAANAAEGIITKTILGPEKVIVKFQVAGTGVEENFTFVKKDSQWNLVLIVDNSG